MKAIILHTPATDNAGARRDAGEQLTVGDGAEDIAPDRAQALVAAASAIEATLSATAAKRTRTQPDAASDEAE